MATVLKAPVQNMRPLPERVRDASWESLWLLSTTARSIVRNIDARCLQDQRDPTEDEEQLWSQQERIEEAAKDEMRRRLQAVIGEVPLQELMGVLS